MKTRLNKSLRKTVITLLMAVAAFGAEGRDIGIVKNHKQISRKDGLYSNEVTAIQQDPFGRIWVGTSGGLNTYSSSSLSNETRYDGKRICGLLDTGERMIISTSKGLFSYNYRSGITQELLWEGNDISYSTSLFFLDGRAYTVAGRRIFRIGDNELTLAASDMPPVIVADKFGTLWGSERNEIFRIGGDLAVEARYTLRSPDNSPVTSMSIFADSKGSVWVGTLKDGLFRYNRTQNEFLKEPLAPRFTPFDPESIGGLCEDRYGRLWIGHNSGLALYDPADGYYREYMFENSYNMLLNTVVTGVLHTREEGIVVGTFFTGFFYINEIDSPVKFHNIPPPGLRAGIVAANGMTRDDAGNLWVGTNFAGVNVYDSDDRFLRQYNQANSGMNDNIVPLEFDSGGNLWAGSMSNGLYRLGKEGKVRHYVNQPDNDNTLNGNVVHVLKALGPDSLLIGTNSGIDLLTSHGSVFTHLAKAEQEDFAFFGVLEKGNKIYLLHYASVLCYDRADGSVTEDRFLEELDSVVQCGCIDGDGNIILGTGSGDIYYYREGELVSMFTEKGVTGKAISNITTDKTGKIWLTAGSELISVDTDREIRRTDLQWGMTDHEFNIRSMLQDDGGTIYFGTTNGFVSFDPSRIYGNRVSVPSLYISDFKLFDRSIFPGEGRILSSHINNCESIILDHSDNFISFTVNNIDYSPYHANYKVLYRLNGFDDNWYELNRASGEIVFTGLPSGKYRLEVVCRSDNGEVLASKQIAMRIKPPVYFSWYMILVYVIIAAAAGWIVSIFLKRQRNARQAIETAKAEQRETERINAMKLDFFTYISHEFKTPLAIISALQNEVLAPECKYNEEGEMLRRNVQRLEYLITQLMDFRNMESQLASIDERKYDLVAFLRQIYEAFFPLYRQKEIAYDFRTELLSLPMVFDADKMEMLVGNLVSNAFKHTLPNGNSYIEVSERDGLAIVDIFNSGDPISEEQKKKIFLPYNHSSSSAAYANSGLGLAIVESITRLLGIRLSVVDVPDKGNIFRLEIPIVENTDKVATRDNRRINIVDQIIDDSEYIQAEESVVAVSANPSLKFTILLVENDADMRKMMRMKLRDSFNIVLASNGRDALLTLKGQDIDVVITDVRMPEMDGFELCAEIKQNPDTHHLPVLMISSDHSSESKIKGFRAGADAFLQKPVNIQELILRLDNILKNKNILRNYYSGFENLAVEPHEMNNADEYFLRNLSQYVTEHIADTELSVTQLAKHLNISRTQLYLNTKRLTGNTPSAFILDVKMKKASQMLRTTDLTSSEISHMLGYCNPHHFSRQFKEFFGCSPSQYRKEQS